MGACASAQAGKGGGAINWPPSSATVIHSDGRMEEFRRPIRAGYVLSGSPGCFLASSELMRLGAHVPHVPDHEWLQVGQIYFAIPLSQSREPLSLRRLGELAAKASSALAAASTSAARYPRETRSFRNGRYHYGISGCGSELRRSAPV